MTPTEITAAARDLYNATGDTYFSDSQMYNWLWQACHQLARKTFCIERTYTTTTSIGTQDYAYPTYALAIKRALVNGRKITRITHREDDAVTLSNASVTSTGAPVYYTDFERTISLRPIPDTTYKMKVFTFNDAQPITASSTLEIPDLYHFDTVDFLLMQMFAKDKDLANVGFHQGEWRQHVVDAIAFEKKRKRTDQFATVQSEDNLPVNIIGAQ